MTDKPCADQTPEQLEAYYRAATEGDLACVRIDHGGHLPSSEYTVERIMGGRRGRGAEGVEVGLRGGEGGHGEVLSPSGGEAEPRGTTAPGGAVVRGGQLPPRATSGSIRVTR